MRCSAFLARACRLPSAGGDEPAGRKRGPKVRMSDAEVVEPIRVVHMACPFHEEGSRKGRPASPTSA